MSSKSTAAPPLSTAKEPFAPYLFKRGFDILFSLLILLLFSPLFVLLALLISLSSKGGAIYTQKRLGRGGRVFLFYKFRTMHQDADKRLRDVLASSCALEQEWHYCQKLKQDPRIFPIGRWLRKTSLDELPQFWNVLRGDLSVVGPRPYMVAQRRELGPLAAKILSVKPGITGTWQTSGRSRTSFQSRIELDAAYIDKCSLLYDLYLIAKTIPRIFYSGNGC